MFEALTERFQKIFKTLRGQAKLTEEHLDAALGGIREALLEADVSLPVVDELIAQVRQQALGAEVLLPLSPDQQVVKVVRDQMLGLLGSPVRPQFASRPPSVWLLVGLQGSGKTTTAGKLGRWLSEHGHRPLLVSTDIYRPAAREQLAQVARAVGAACFASGESDPPLEIVRGALREARLGAYDVIVVDTAGRLHIDEPLMQELAELKQALSPSEILLVADAMTGQDAVRSASEFHRRLGLTGIVLTKLDGDARGGAALSIRRVSGAPVKFTGVGEKYDALEPFYPDRIVSRILGMGDVLSLIEKVEKTLDQRRAAQMAERLRRSEFTLEDFREQLRQLRRMGPLEQVLELLPRMGPLAHLPRQADIDEQRLRRLEAIINSMTPEERLDPRVIDGSRRRRIARGSGTTVQEVNQLLRQFQEMRRLVKQYGSLRGRLRGLGRLAGLS
jgi:signal recognition particle subunit SRP54